MKEELRLSELGGAVIDAAARDLVDYSVGFVCAVKRARTPVGGG